MKGGCRIDALAGQQHSTGNGVTRCVDDRADARDQAHVHSRCSEGRPFARDPKVTCQSEFEATAVRWAIDCSDNRNATRMNGMRGFANGDQHGSIIGFRGGGNEFVDVRASAEASFSTMEYNRSLGEVLVNRGERVSDAVPTR